jgi:hypothetical protein
MWEIFSDGAQPYIGIINLAAYLEQGSRLAKPLGCDDDLYGLMNSCWTQNRYKRYE